MKISLYLAGGLFNAGERLHNLYLEKYLKELGYPVILPQRSALNFFKDGLFQLESMVDDCQKQCLSPENLYVGNLDGPDADSGTSMEYGVAITATGRAVVYRTDFRTALEKEVGVNGMFYAKSTKLVYLPCFFTELDQVEAYYQKLAQSIDDAVQSLFRQKRKAVYVQYHSDPKCGGSRLVAGYCHRCEVLVEKQDVRLRAHCPDCGVLLKELLCPVCHEVFIEPS